MTYFIGKDKFVHKITSLNGYGEPHESKREVKSKVTQDIYVDEYLKYLGGKDIALTRQKCPTTVLFLEYQYQVLYLKKDIEIDEDLLATSLHEIGKLQKDAHKLTINYL